MSIFLYVFSKHRLSITVFGVEITSLKDCWSFDISDVIVVVLEETVDDDCPRFSLDIGEWLPFATDEPDAAEEDIFTSMSKGYINQIY